MNLGRDVFRDGRAGFAFREGVRPFTWPDALRSVSPSLPVFSRAGTALTSRSLILHLAHLGRPSSHLTFRRRQVRHPVLALCGARLSPLSSLLSPSIPPEASSPL